MIQQVQSDGVTPSPGTSAQTLLHRDDVDGPDIEAPSMYRSASGTYILFFSSNCFATPLYDISYAYSSSPTGGFTKSSVPWKVAPQDGLSGPGGADIHSGGSHMLFHGLQGDGPIRALYAASVAFDGDVVVG